jgi:hypothetical protein
MFNPSGRIAFLICVGCFVSGCAQIKEAGRTIGHTTRDATKEIGHTTRDVTREIGHGARDVTREIGHGTRDAVRDIRDGTIGSAKGDEEEAKKVVKPTSETSDY